MGQITAWECDHTGQLFRTEKEYRSNARKVNRQLALEEKARLQKENEVERLQPMYQRSTFRALEKWILDHATLIRKFGSRSVYGRDRVTGNLVSVHLHGMRWGEQSCSHSAPLGKRSNWGGRDKGPNGETLPRTYPGWKGRIVLFFDNDGNTGTLCDGLKPIGICTGGGGSSSAIRKSARYPKGYCLSYDVTLWAEDFPKLVPTKGQYDNSGFGTRTLDSIRHDVFHYDRASVGHRIEKWEFLKSSLQVLRENVGANPPASHLTPYCRAWSDERTERDINYTALAFAKDYQYLIIGLLDFKIAERISRNCERGDDLSVRGLARYGGGPFLAMEADDFVGWKLSGELSPDARIVDLRARYERLTGSQIKGRADRRS